MHAAAAAVRARVHVTPAALQAQYELASAISRLADEAYAASQRVGKQNATLSRALARANGGLVLLLLTVEYGDGAPTAMELHAFRTQAAALADLQRRAHRP